MTAQQQHWQIETDENNIAWLNFDKHDSSTNVLAKDVLAELDTKLSDIKKLSVKALIIASAKSNGFIAGADIEGFTKLKNIDEGRQLITDAQAIFNQLEELPFPSICLIHGFCLGGGLELALSCTYRIALDEPKTKLGFPEIKLGIFPGFGGTLRSTRLLGAPTAMNLMLTGRNLSARAAKRAGLVDLTAPQRLLRQTAINMALSPPKPHQASFLQKLTNNALVRPIIANMMRKQVRQKAQPEHYPAPFALIDHWQAHAGSAKAMLTSEANKVAELVLGETAQNLIHVFYLMETLKNQGNKSNCQAKHVHVIGAGVMGGDIAAWCALQGLHVTIEDQKPEFLSKMMKRSHDLFRKKLKLPHLVKQAMDRIVPDIQGAGVRKADVVIEAIFENIEAKHALYQRIEPQVKADTLIATNTSSIKLEVLSSVMQKPERLVGLHFFNPVAMMQLVEIVAGENTSPEVVKQAADFTRLIDRLPLPVKSGPGFLVNRVLMPYLIEAVTMVEEKIPPELIDRAALEFGMPMGPVELADTVGLDICLHVAEILSQDMDIAVPERLKKMVSDGKLGKKSGQGFYQYQKGKKISQNIDPKLTPDDAQDRMIMRMINEATACLRDNIVENKQLLDAGIIFGTGFAPFKGGPMHYVEAKSSTAVITIIDKLSDKYGQRFNKDKGWEDM
jgi:3-hydroxyacyl-CoA dehydrogenase / enoyl-CoA hydratase / 3-hydroxybutyryl-CoA epimerase